MPHYRYTDWSKGEVIATIHQVTRGGIPWGDGPYHAKHSGEVIFECDADDILAADEAFTKATGRIPAKEFLVGCSVET